MRAREEAAALSCRPCTKEDTGKQGGLRREQVPPLERVRRPAPAGKGATKVAAAASRGGHCAVMGVMGVSQKQKKKQEGGESGDGYRQSASTSRSDALVGGYPWRCSWLPVR